MVLRLTVFVQVFRDTVDFLVTPFFYIFVILNCKSFAYSVKDVVSGVSHTYNFLFLVIVWTPFFLSDCCAIQGFSSKNGGQYCKQSISIMTFMPFHLSDIKKKAEPDFKL